MKWSWFFSSGQGYYINHSGDYRNSRALIGREFGRIPLYSPPTNFQNGCLALYFVAVSEEKMYVMKGNAIPKNTKHATKFKG